MSTPIKGYRKLTEEEIALMNRIKDHSEGIRVLVEALSRDGTLDQRWVSIGKTNLQHGFMDLVRAVAQPESF